MCSLGSIFYVLTMRRQNCVISIKILPQNNKHIKVKENRWNYRVGIIFLLYTFKMLILFSFLAMGGKRLLLDLSDSFMMV